MKVWKDIPVAALRSAIAIMVTECHIGLSRNQHRQLHVGAVKTSMPFDETQRDKQGCMNRAGNLNMFNVMHQQAGHSSETTQSTYDVSIVGMERMSTAE